MFNIIGHTKVWFVLSALTAILGLAAIFTWGLRVGIDYRGGTVMEIETNKPIQPSEISQILQKQNLKNSQVKTSGENKAVLRLPALSNDEHVALSKELKEKLGGIQETQYDTVGPTIGKDLTRKSVLAVIFASLGIIFYIAYAFRKLPRPLSAWAFGLFAVIALVHDLLITTGLVTLLGHYYYWMEIDVLFITALLTIMGFSVHDTIVVYDRLRENFLRNPHRNIALAAEESVNQTLARSINTSLTVILVLSALFLLGGQSIRHFVLTLLIGIVVGTYSSIFVASPLVVVWHQKKFQARKSKASLKFQPQRA